MDENPDRGINKNDRTVDLYESTTRRSGSKNTSPEDACESECDPFLHSPSQRCSPDSFPRLSGSDRKRGLRSNRASEFWSQGVPNLGALSSRSNGQKQISNSTPSILEPSKPPADRDIDESVPTDSGDQLHRSGILPSLKSDGTSADSSGVNHLARPVPDSSITVFDDVPNHRNEPPRPSLGNPMETPPPNVETRDRSSGLEAQKRCSNIAASESDSPTKPRGEKENDSLMAADAMSLHAGYAGSKITSHLEIMDDLQSAPSTGKSRPAIPTDPGLSDRVYPRPLSPEQRQTPYTSPKPSQVAKHNEPCSANATSHLSEPRSATLITPTKKHKIWHPKSASTAAPAFHPGSSSNSATTPTRSSSNGHRRSVSSGTGHLNPSSRSFIPNTPLRQRRLSPYRHSNMGTPSVPLQPAVFNNTGGAPQPSVKAHYPGPHQHIPERQGQYFSTQPSMRSQMPIQSGVSLGPSMPLFFSPNHSSNNNIFHYNAQVYQQGEQNAEYSQTNHFDSYATSQAANAAPNAADLHQNGNMYAQDTNGYGPRYYSNHTDPSHQVHFLLAAHRLCMTHEYLAQPASLHSLRTSSRTLKAQSEFCERSIHSRRHKAEAAHQD